MPDENQIDFAGEMKKAHAGGRAGGMTARGNVLTVRPAEDGIVDRYVIRRYNTETRRNGVGGSETPT